MQHHQHFPFLLVLVDSPVLVALLEEGSRLLHSFLFVPSAAVERHLDGGGFLEILLLVVGHDVDAVSDYALLLLEPVEIPQDGVQLETLGLHT